MASVAARGVSTCPNLDIFQGQLLRRNTTPLRAGEIRLGFELVIDEWEHHRAADDPATALIRQIIKHLNANVLSQYGIEAACFDVVCLFNAQTLAPATQDHGKVIWFYIKLLPEFTNKEKSLTDYVLRPRNGRPLRESEYAHIGDNYWVPKIAVQYYENVLATRAAARSSGSSTVQTVQQQASSQDSSHVAPVRREEHNQNISAHVSEQTQTNDQASSTRNVGSDVQQSHPALQAVAAPITPSHPATGATDAANPTPVFHGGANIGTSHPTTNQGTFTPHGSTTSGFVPQIQHQPQLNTTNVPFAAGYTGVQAPQDATVPVTAAGQQLGPTITGGTHTTNQGTSTIQGSMMGAVGPPTQQQVGHGTTTVPPIPPQHQFMNVGGNVPFGTANLGLQAPLKNVRPFAHFSLPHAAPVLPPPQAGPAVGNTSVLPSSPMVGVVPTQTANILPAIVVPPADVDVVMIDAWLLDVYEAAARLLKLLSPVVGPRAL